jgi:hypothetical protein
MRMRTALRLAAGTAALGAATLAYAGLVERNLFTLRRYVVPVLPPDAEPLRVLHVSDLHLTPGQARKRRWVSALATTDPDLVVVTGDNIAHPDAVPAAVRTLGPLLDMPGVFVFGSNDYTGPVWGNPFRYFKHDREYVHGVELPVEELRGALREAGWVDLNNARTTIKAGGVTVEVVGVDDPHIGRDDYAPLPWPTRPSHGCSTRWRPTASTSCWPATPTAGRSACPGWAPWSPTAGWTGGWPAACTAGRARRAGCTCRPAWVPIPPPRSGSAARRRRRC